jgi:hypothetical protein
MTIENDFKTVRLGFSANREQVEAAEAACSRIEAVVAHLRRERDKFKMLWDDRQKLVDSEAHYLRGQLWKTTTGAAEELSKINEENDRFLAALEQIRDTDPEVTGPNGDCAYCESRTVARPALEEIG